MPRDCNAGAARDLRDMFGQFASGVTVIACGPEGDEHGMTANAFMSVSLDPPLVTVSLQNDCRMSSRLKVGDRFGVSILAEDQRAASDHFAGRAIEADAARFERKANAPVLQGALAWIAGTVVQQAPAGDHTLYIARVEDFDRSGGTPLLFFGGAYRRISQEAGQ